VVIRVQDLAVPAEQGVGAPTLAAVGSVPLAMAVSMAPPAEVIGEDGDGLTGTPEEGAPPETSATGAA
jgi:hypothetical protein